MNLKLHALFDEINGEGSDLGGGADAGTGAAADGAQPGADAGAGGAAAPEGPTTEGMYAQIKQGLAAGGIVDLPGDDKAAVKLAAADPANAGKPAAPAVTDQAKADADKLAADTLVKKKPDDPELVLTDEEKRILGPKANARFQKLTHYGEVQFERAERVQQENVTLTTAKDNILKTFSDAKATPADLSSLLNLNFMMKSGDREGALRIIDATRADLLKSLGREAPGVDLLTDHADLKAAVDNQEMTRAAALEVANARRTTAANQQNQSQQQNQQRQQNEVQRTQQTALADIQKWGAEMSASDIDYSAREARLTPQIAEIIRDYQPHQWLPTIKRLYATIAVNRAPVVPITTNSLRPNGAKPGAKAPASMLDALKTGLGYASGS